MKIKGLTSSSEHARTGWPASALMQDDCKGLSRWLSERPFSRFHARQAAEAIERSRVVSLADLVSRAKLIVGE